MVLTRVYFKHWRPMEIEILTKNEIILMNNPPALNYQQKEYYFNISGDLLENLQINYKKENIAYFILLYGYFRISNKFYTVNANAGVSVHSSRRISVQ